jgi:hypothetical protein
MRLHFAAEAMQYDLHRAPAKCRRGGALSKADGRMRCGFWHLCSASSGDTFCRDTLCAVQIRDPRASVGLCADPGSEGVSRLMCRSGIRGRQSAYVQIQDPRASVGICAVEGTIREQRYPALLSCRRGSKGTMYCCLVGEEKQGYHALYAAYCSQTTHRIARFSYRST